MSTVSTMSPTSSTSSDRRVAANRANARKSTGPRTPEGKARAALNALKTGCFARTPTIPGEDEAELEAFVGEIIEDLKPADAVERDLAERVAGLSWRRRRLWRAEAEVIAKEFGDVGDPEESFDTDEDRQIAELEASLDGQAFLASQFTGKQPGPLVRIADHERRLSGSIDAALRMLIKVQDRRLKYEREAAQEPLPARNEAIEARHIADLEAESAGEPSVEAPAVPNEATAAPALQSAPVRNEAIARGGAAHRAPRTNEPTVAAIPWTAPARNEAIVPGQTRLAGTIQWGDVVATAVSAVASRSAPGRTNPPRAMAG